MNNFNSKIKCKQMQIFLISVIMFLVMGTNQNKMQIDGKYKAVRCIDQGAYGIVLEVTFNGRHYAIKMIRITYESQVKAAIQEAKALVEVKCKNVVKVYRYFTWGNYFCILMEKCEASLKQVFKTLSQRKKRRFCRQIIKGALYIHSKEKAHRDFKLENIMIKNWKIKIIDFGFAISLASGDYTRSEKGTTVYKSPESLVDGKYTRKVDCWAIGLVLLQISTGKRVTEFRENQKPPASYPDFPSEADLAQVQDPKIKKVIRMLLERQPERRASFKQAKKQLEYQEVYGELYTDIAQKIGRIDENTKELVVFQQQKPSLLTMSYPLHIGIDKFAQMLYRFRKLEYLSLHFNHSLNYNSNFDCLVSCLNSLSSLKQVLVIVRRNQWCVIDDQNNWGNKLRSGIKFEVYQDFDDQDEKYQS